MIHPNYFNKKLDLLGFYISACLLFPVAAFGQLVVIDNDSDADIEEITVTGSYIRNTTINSASPLSVIGIQDIEDTGNVNIAQVISDLPFISGTVPRAGLRGGNAGNTSINIRGLGAGATLTLLNGRRNVGSGDGGTANRVNILNLVPQIAVERLEILKDGASAIYGSDAVAGVANVLTRDDFEGFEVEAFYQQNGNVSSATESKYEFIFGAGNERGHFMMSGSYFESNPMHAYETFDRIPPMGISGTGKSFRPRAKNNDLQLGGADGVSGTADDLTYAQLDGWGSTARYGDLNCAAAGGLPHPGDDSSKADLGGPYVWVEDPRGRCGFNYGPYFQYVQDVDRLLMYSSARYSLSNSVEAYGELSIANNGNDRTQSPYPFTAFSPLIPSYNPGVIEDGIRRGAIAGTEPWAPVDMLYSGRTNIGLNGRELGSALNSGRRDRSKYRFVGGLEGEIPGTDTWRFNTAGTWSKQQVSWMYTDNSKLRSQLGANGLGGIGCNPFDATNIANAKGSQWDISTASGSQSRADEMALNGCYFWNPYFNSVYDRQGSFVRGTDVNANYLANPDEVYGYMVQEVQYYVENSQIIYDAVVSGEVMDLPAGPLSIAVGAQYRYDDELIDYDGGAESFDYTFTGGDIDSEIDRDVWAAFIEAQVPVTEKLVLSLATRFESYTSEMDSLDYKIAGIYNVNDSMAIRSSWSTSFQAPSIADTTRKTVGLSYINDTYGQDYYPITTQPGTNLKPAESETWNIGFSVIPGGVIEGFTFDMDYWNVEFEDLIAVENAGTLVAFDIGCDYCLNERVQRYADGTIDNVNLSRVNVGGVNASGVDFTAGYSFDTSDFGSFRLGVAGAWIQTYDETVQNPVTKVSTVADRVGWLNYQSASFAAAPEWKLNYKLNWNLGNHRANIQYIYMHDLLNDDGGGENIAYSLGFASLDANGKIQANPGECNTRGGTRTNPCPIDSYGMVNAQYTYTIPENFLFGVGGGSDFTLGINNLTNEIPPIFTRVSSFATSVHDPRGRMFYGRFRMRF